MRSITFLVDDKYEDIINYIQKKPDYSRYICETIYKEMKNKLQLAMIEKQIEGLSEGLSEEREIIQEKIDEKNGQMFEKLIDEFRKILKEEIAEFSNKAGKMIDYLHENINESTGAIVDEIVQSEEHTYNNMNNAMDRLLNSI